MRGANRHLFFYCFKKSPRRTFSHARGYLGNSEDRIFGLNSPARNLACQPSPYKSPAPALSPEAQSPYREVKALASSPIKEEGNQKTNSAVPPTQTPARFGGCILVCLLQITWRPCQTNSENHLGAGFLIKKRVRVRKWDCRPSVGLC